MSPPTVHGNVVAIDGIGILIRGASGAGKSRLSLDLITEARRDGRDVALVADDRVELSSGDGRLLAKAPAALAGLIEVRHLGILNVPYREAAAIGLVVDLVPGTVARVPDRTHETVRIANTDVRRIELPERDYGLARTILIALFGVG